MMAHEIETAAQLLAAWDEGDSIHSLEMGGLGPGYEQAIQILAVEFTRAAMDNFESREGESLKEEGERFKKLCNETLTEDLDNDIGGATGAQFGAACWLAYQWSMGGGPKGLIEKAKTEGQEDRVTLVSRAWPKAPEQKTAA